MDNETGILTLTIAQWATFEKRLTWKDEAGAVIDLAAWSARLQVRSEKGAADALLELSTADGSIVLAAAAPNIVLYLDSETTGALAWEVGVYDLVLEDADGVRRRLLEGPVFVDRAVTEFEVS